MPRKSSAELAVIPAPSAFYDRRSPPRPRDDAPADVAQVFRELVRSTPKDHFRSGDGALLEQYSQSIVLARQAYAQLAADGPVVGGKASPWLVVLEKAHRSSVALSGRLRLAPRLARMPDLPDETPIGRRCPPTILEITNDDAQRSHTRALREARHDFQTVGSSTVGGR